MPTLKVGVTLQCQHHHHLLVGSAQLFRLHLNCWSAVQWYSCVHSCRLVTDPLRLDGDFFRLNTALMLSARGTCCANAHWLALLNAGDKETQTITKKRTDKFKQKMACIIPFCLNQSTTTTATATKQVNETGSAVDAKTTPSCNCCWRGRQRAVTFSSLQYRNNPVYLLVRLSAVTQICAHAFQQATA